MARPECGAKLGSVGKVLDLRAKDELQSVLRSDSSLVSNPGGRTRVEM